MVVLLAALFALALVLLLWLWASGPQLPQADFSAFHKYDYAHRGLHNREKGVPENSLMAFELAARGGFGMELDVQLTQDGQVVGTYSLQQPRTLRYESQDGGYNIVVIADGKVRVSEASCPDQVCVRTGPTDQTASPIACLPNRLVIQVIDNGTSSQLDGVS